MPLNIVNLGLANGLFPKAKVLVALRDPRDACLSCFMQRFQFSDAMASFAEGSVDILVATPGRLEDHLSTGAVRLDRTATVVLDEADQMLDLGFSLKSN